MTIDNTTKVYLGGVEQVKIIKNGSVIWEKQQDNTDYFYIQNNFNGSNTVTLTTTKTGTPTSGTYATSVSWSKDKSTWTTITLTAAQQRTFTLNQGEKVYFRNDSGKWSSYVNDNNFIYNTFTSTQSIVSGGELYTLLDYTNSSVGLSIGCFLNLFRGCTTLVTAPDLSFTTMATRCYQNIFYGCTSLTTAPSFPATTMADYCYQGALYGCTSLTTAPALPATTLASGCYQSMFRGCTSLTTAPSLPATTLANGCYGSMFRECSGLTATPSLQATTLASSAYVNMFRDCTSLNSVTTYANDISATNCISNWLNNVAATGTFNNLGSATYTTSSASGIPTGWTEVKPQPAIDYFYIQNDYNGSNTITITTNKYDYSEEDPEADPLDMTKCGTTLEWSKDKSTWTTLTLSENSPNTITMNQGEKVYFRNDTGKLNYADDWGSWWYSSFTNSQNASTGGDIHTLIDYTGTNINNRENYCLQNLFQGNQNLISASNLTLPSSLVVGELKNLFMVCSSLTTPPSLPATTLTPHCYNGMFFNCTSLTTPPSLPATTLADSCYCGMFHSSGITTAPTLPATTLDIYCYDGMFNSCSSLTTPPALPATNLEYGCYNYMFENSGITTAPTLPATTLAEACYTYMFMNCYSLTTPPSLPATTLEGNCYSYMFAGSGITTPPSLPATTLATYCYTGMLADTDITTAPELYASTLEEGCYQEMFANCDNLNEVTCYATDITATDCLTDWLSNVAASGTLYAQRGVNYPTDDASGVPTGWSIVRMEPN